MGRKRNLVKSAVVAGCCALLSIFRLCYADDPVLRIISAVETDSRPTIDGILDDPCWKQATRSIGFVQYSPLPGEAISQETTVYLAHDRNRLYVAFECLKADMNRLAANSTRRDASFSSDDYVEVFLDTYLDGRNCYSFALNPLGTQKDRRITNEGANMRSALSWDCDWDGQATIQKDRWTAEFSIPFAELRFPTHENRHAVWGINFWRKDESREEEQSWVDLGSRKYAVSRFGHLTQLPVHRLATRRPLEIRPYGAAKLKNIANQEREMDADTGVDLRYPLSNVSVDFTIHPDFAQIEADSDRVNLTDIPLRFPEKRPFFLEGNELFLMPVELFYSRRVENLIGGGKIAGKVSRYNFAILDAQAGSDELDEEIEEGHLPLGEYNYSVFRLQRELGKTSTVGLLGVNKQRGRMYDRASGVDARLTLPQNVDLNLEYAKKWKYGAANDKLIYAQLSRRTNRFSFELKYTDIGENFDLETGFIPRLDRRGVLFSTKYTKRQSGLVQRLRGGAKYKRLENHDGQRTNEHREVNGSIRIQDYFLWLGSQWYFHLTDENIAYTDKLLKFHFGWSPPKWVSIRNFGLIGVRDDKDSFFIRPEISLRPTSKLSFKIILQRLVEDSALEQWTRRLTINYQFAQRIYTRATAEITIEKERRVFVLFAYEYQPESTLFIVYNDNRDAHLKTERILFLKISHLLKIGPVEG